MQKHEIAKSISKASQRRAGHTERRVCVLVLGMHRSGTSVLTGLFGALGCEMPKTLLKATPDNLKGYWESRAVMELNDAALASAGSKWDDLALFNIDWYSSPIYLQFLERGREVIRDEFSNSPFFVLKDPRICRLTPYWLAVLEAEQVLPVAALALRNPMEVAQSLQKRDGMSLEYGLLLWLGHMLEAERASREIPRIVVSYNQSLQNWRDVADNAGRVFGFAWPRPEAVSSFDLAQYLDPNSRHNQIDDKETFENRDISVWIRDTYRILNRFSLAPLEREAVEDLEMLDLIREQVNVAIDAFRGFLLAAERNRQDGIALEREVVRLQEDLSATSAAHDALTIERDQMQQALDDLAKFEAETLHAQEISAKAAARAEVLEASLLMESERLTALEKQVDERQSASEALKAELNYRLEAQAELEMALRAAKEELLGLESLRHEVALQNSRLEQRGEELTQAWAHVKRLEDRLELFTASQRELEQALIEERDRAVRLDGKLAESERWVFNLAGERSKADAAIARLQQQLRLQERALTSAENAAERLDAQLKQARQTIATNSIAVDPSQIEEMGRQNTYLKNELVAAQQALRSAEPQLAQLPEFQRKLEERVKEIALITGMLKQAEEDAQAMAAKLVAVPELQRKLSERVDEITIMTGLLKQAEEDAQAIAQRQDWLLAVNAVLTRRGRWWRLMPARWARARQAKRLAENNLFDSELYLEMYPDVAQSRMVPIEHFLRHGLEEGRLCPR
jgi:hypothetical protein